jgi:hypothetical protein
MALEGVSILKVAMHAAWELFGVELVRDWPAPTGRRCAAVRYLAGQALVNQVDWARGS